MIARNDLMRVKTYGGLWKISAWIALLLVLSTDLPAQPPRLAASARYKSRSTETISAAPSGIISTLAGSGAIGSFNGGYSGDGGLATAALLSNPSGVAVDSAGNVYIADTSNSRVRKVSPDGIIRTVAGNGKFGLAGDGGHSRVAEQPWWSCD